MERLHALLLMPSSKLMRCRGVLSIGHCEEFMFKKPQNPARAANSSVLKRLLYRSLRSRCPFLLVMSDVMCIVTNYVENQAGLLFRVDSARLFVMSVVIFNV